MSDTLKLSEHDDFIWQADAEITKPWCISKGDSSYTLWIEDNKIVGALHHEYQDGKIVNVKGAGKIPGEYVAFEENASL